MTILARTPEQIGHAIRQARLDQGLNQTQLAQKAGTFQNAISNIENGHAGVRLDTILRVLAALNLDFTVQPRASDARSIDAMLEDLL